METLFSMLGLYQLSALVLPGAVAVSGAYYAVPGMTPDDAKAYDAALRQLIQTKLDTLVGSDTSALPVGEKFALARAELRRQSQDVRSESFNSIYGLSRGLVSAGVLVVVVGLVCVIVGHAAHRNW